MSRARKREPMVGDVYLRRNGTHFKVAEIRDGLVYAYPMGTGRNFARIPLATFHKLPHRLVREAARASRLPEKP